MDLFRAALVFCSAAALIPGICSVICETSHIKCLGKQKCIPDDEFCNGKSDCEDRSDERYCTFQAITKEGGCPSSWFPCKNGQMCIPKEMKCNSVFNCNDRSDEELCDYSARFGLTNWFLSYRRGHKGTRSRHNDFRTAISLYFMDKNFFTMSDRQNWVSELKSQILSALTKDLKSNELSLSIYVLMAICSNPWEFHGFNIVSELRTRMNRSRKPNPSDLLALCTAHDEMTPQDAQRSVDVFVSKTKRFKRDNQALALQALACIRSRINFTLNGTTMAAMEQELKQLQLENGTFGSVRTTALVLQALIATQSSLKDFRFDDAMEAILKTQTLDYLTYGLFGSLSDSYYVAPLLNGASFLNISNSHCQADENESGDFPGILKRKSSGRTEVKYSVRTDNNEKNTWTLYVPDNCSLHDVTAIIKLLGNRLNVLYHVVDGKPLVASVNGVQEDLERGLYWFIYMRLNNEEYILERSPVDIIIRPKWEYILWYKERE